MVVNWKQKRLMVRAVKRNRCGVTECLFIWMVLRGAVGYTGRLKFLFKLCSEELLEAGCCFRKTYQMVIRSKSPDHVSVDTYHRYVVIGIQ